MNYLSGFPARFEKPLKPLKSRSFLAAAFERFFTQYLSGFKRFNKKSDKNHQKARKKQCVAKKQLKCCLQLKKICSNVLDPRKIVFCSLEHKKWVAVIALMLCFFFSVRCTLLKIFKRAQKLFKSCAVFQRFFKNKPLKNRSNLARFFNVFFLNKPLKPLYLKQNFRSILKRNRLIKPLKSCFKLGEKTRLG